MLRSCLAPLLILGADVMFWHSYHYLVHQSRIEGDFSYTCTPKKFPTIAAVGWPWAPSFTPSAPGMQPTCTPPASLYDACLATTLVALYSPHTDCCTHLRGQVLIRIAVFSVQFDVHFSIFSFVGDRQTSPADQSRSAPITRGMRMR